jgi:DNA topoisomerase-1
MAKNLVIVESPGKINKIQGFLGKDYKVVASYGHVRDLDKGTKGIDKKNNFTPNYIVSADKVDVVKNLKKLVKESEKVYLAQDQDREGEAISFHLKEVLNLSENKYDRIVFQEITKQAIENALKNPRKIDMDLVNAQQARRILDRLVGFDLSPLLWKKIQQGLSAGRVQSVAVKLIAEREKEINAFESLADFKVVGLFDYIDKNKNYLIKSVLDKRFKEKSKVKEFLERCIGKEFIISNIEKKPSKRSPSAPFTTSTLQQIASRNLGFSVSRTMTVAQKLYEGGHITYMRTDSTVLSEEILNSAKAEIKKIYGEEYSKQREYKTKNKSAQEAHEAIRPTHIENHSINDGSDEIRLYELIWKRTIASQMADAEIEKTVLQITNKDIKEKFIAQGEVIKFDGFLKVYKETDSDEKEEGDEGNKTLPKVKLNDPLDINEITANETYKKPQPRYSEASLVKKLEELGIGRPSTYASIISTIQKRNYVKIADSPAKERIIISFSLKNNTINESTKKENYGAEKSKFFSTDIGMVVTDYLSENFNDVINYKFTANVEEKFDEIANGKIVWTEMISEFYNPFHEKVNESTKKDEKRAEREIGECPDSGKKIIARLGKFGPMVQLGDKDENGKLKCAKLKEGQSIQSITLEEAVALLRWPRVLGDYKKDSVTVAIGRFGPYVKYKEKYYSIKEHTPEEITLDQAIEVIDEKDKGGAGGGVIKEFKKDEIRILNGKFGPYISKKGKNYKIPESKDAGGLTLADCTEIIKNKKAYDKKKKEEK